MTGKGDKRRPEDKQAYDYGYELAFGGAMLKRCNCKHDYQDKKYGKKLRVHTETASNKGPMCTVCGDRK